VVTLPQQHQVGGWVNTHLVREIPVICLCCLVGDLWLCASKPAEVASLQAMQPRANPVYRQVPCPASWSVDRPDVLEAS
jgi:hypothetical protein